MIVAFDMESGSPPSTVLMNKKSYDPKYLIPLPGHPIEADMKRTSRKLFWEASYIIRKAE